MKIYIHTGKGHYIGSAVIVITNNMHDASVLIRESLNESGLKEEVLNIKEVEIENNKLIYLNNGDY